MKADLVYKIQRRYLKEPRREGFLLLNLFINFDYWLR
jgi:hypothetical protein